MAVGSSCKQLVPFKRGLGFKSSFMQYHLLVASPATARHATRDDHQISRGNPDTGAGDKKKYNKKFDFFSFKPCPNKNQSFLSFIIIIIINTLQDDQPLQLISHLYLLPFLSVNLQPLLFLN